MQYALADINWTRFVRMLNVLTRIINDSYWRFSVRFLLSFLLVFFIAAPVFGAWDFDKHSIPVDEIMSGGPPKDGIPALMSPKYVSAREASFLSKDDQVIGVVLNGEARAYPLRIMSWHELVNDRIGDLAILVSW